MTDTRPDLFPRRYWGYLALLAWGGLTLFLLRHAPYALDEGGAKALLLDWSIGDQVANSVVTLGLPDMRVLLWVPLGFLWPGQILAAKVSLVLIMGFTAVGLFRWAQRTLSEEVALLATGLLLIAPLTLQQVDSLSPGIPLLATFTLGYWCDQAYRESPRPFGGMYFAQLALCLFAVSLHPAGLAFPLALLWGWRVAPLNRVHQRYFYVGVALMTLLALLLKLGWSDLGGWQNPVVSAKAMLLGTDLMDEPPELRAWVVGLLLLGLVLAIVLRRRHTLGKDLLGRTLLLGALLGAILSDASWGFIALAVLLYGGLAWLLEPRALLLGRGFMVQRGWLWILLLLFSTLAMRADRAWYDQNRAHLMSAQDQLIGTFATDVEQLRLMMEEKGQPMPRIRVASQWPARTMIACRCDALPLPPTAKDAPAQWATLKGLSHLVMKPSDNRNLGLAGNLALLGTEVETISLQPGGVILHIKSPIMAPAAAPPPLEPGN